jgi:hypothetical protein
MYELVSEALETKLFKKVYGPYTKENGRKIVVVITDDGKKITKSYPKWLMEEAAGKEFDINNTVDHIDKNIDNNDISNLKWVERAQHSMQDTRRVKMIKLVCDMCGKDFERSPRLLRISAKLNQGIVCSKSCAGRYGRLRALNKIKKLKKAKPVKSEYYSLHDFGDQTKSP